MIVKLMTLVIVASFLSSSMIFANDGETTQVDAASSPATPAEPSVNSGNELPTNPEVGAASKTSTAKGKREIARRRHKRKHHRKHHRGRR